jgi:hypothetical protein
MSSSWGDGAGTPNAGSTRRPCAQRIPGLTQNYKSLNQHINLTELLKVCDVMPPSGCAMGPPPLT